MLGKGISLLSDKYGYGSGFYKIVSEDFKDIFPEVKSFSPTNLKYMRYMKCILMHRIVHKLWTI